MPGDEDSKSAMPALAEDFCKLFREALERDGFKSVPFDDETLEIPEFEFEPQPGSSAEDQTETVDVTMSSVLDDDINEISMRMQGIGSLNDSIHEFGTPARSRRDSAFIETPAERGR